MKAGKLRHLVAFDEPIAEQNETGEEVVTFTEAFRLPASVEPLSGRERITTGQVIAEGNTRICIRWSPQADRINAKWRARHGGVIYNISGPPAHIDKRRAEIEIMATSGVNAG